MTILNDDTFLKGPYLYPIFKTEFKSFLSLSSQSTDNHTLLLETSKAYGRGVIISFSVSKRSTICY